MLFLPLGFEFVEKVQTAIKLEVEKGLGLNGTAIKKRTLLAASQRVFRRDQSYKIMNQMCVGLDLHCPAHTSF